MEIGNNDEQVYTKNKNTNNYGNNDDNVGILMTKTMIIVIMDELVTITIVTVIMMTYRWNSREEKIKINLIKRLVRSTCLEIFFTINVTKRKC